MPEIPEEFQAIFQSISDSYDHHDSDRTLIERSLELSSKELNEAYKKLKTLNQEVEEKNKHIMDSILYAKRIQEAILPHEEVPQQIFSDHFILYKPKDIVSGDFYYIEKLDGKILVAAVDCTGHGVPGAFMSMIGNSLLNEIIKEKKITRPDEILNLLKAGVISALKQKGELGESKDGMDISLCCIDLDNMELQYAGAYNPLYVIRKAKIEEKSKILKKLPEASKIFFYMGHCLMRVKADRFPIGIYIRSEDKVFTNNTLKLEKGDTVYLFTDGLVDQFGGEKQKKFSSKQFRDLLLQFQRESMKKQKKILEDALMEWQGQNDQIDDILVIGIRI